MNSSNNNFGMEGKIQTSISANNEMSFAQAICHATTLAMDKDSSVIILGEGITDRGAIFHSTLGLKERFGSHRVIETPLSENAISGICTGAAMNGLRPIMVHQRIDFALLAMDSLINHAAKWRYMSGGKLKIPLVIRCIVGKGWGQAAQHSQSLQSLFAHIPGLRVVMPATPTDAKGMLIASIEEDNPVIFIESRPLYSLKETVSDEYFKIPLGKARIAREGKNLSIIAVSYLVTEALQVAELWKDKLSIEVIDLRSVSPLDEDTILASVKKTTRALVLDTSHKSFGISAEIASIIHEKCFGQLSAPVARLALPDAPTPCSSELEKSYYWNAHKISEYISTNLIST